MTDILHIFVSHKGNFLNQIDRINSMMQENEMKYIIAIGGGDSDHYDHEKHILQIMCNDKYEGLPEKVFKIFKFIKNNESLSKFKYYCKMDDDMIINKKINSDKISSDYMGKVYTQEGSRTWHINRCTPGSYWNNKEYDGKFVPWCLGGYGYMVSNKVMNIIGDSRSANYEKDIYEDVCIGKFLRNNGIMPYNVHNWTTFYKSPDHA